MNQFIFKNSSRKRPLNNSIYGLSFGFPALEKSKVTLFSYAQKSKSLVINSDPLSTWIRSGVIPWYYLTSSIILTTSMPLIDYPTRVARHWPLKLSTKVKTLNFRPFNSWSATTCRQVGIHPPTLVHLNLLGAFHSVCCHFASARSFTPKIKPFLLVNAVYTIFIILQALTP